MRKMCEFYKTRVHKASKEHVCDGCFNPIPKDSHYEYMSGCNDETFWTAKICSDCAEHLAECGVCSDMAGDIEGWFPGDFGEWRETCMQLKKREQEILAEIQQGATTTDLLHRIIS